MKRTCASTAYSMPKPLTLNKKAPNKAHTFDLGKSRKYIGKKDLFYRKLKIKIKNVYLLWREGTVKASNL